MQAIHTTIEVQITKINGAIQSTASDHLAIEEPLEIRLEHGAHAHRRVETISVTMRTPGADPDLAIGFLYTEGIIQSADQIDMIVQVDAHIVRVVLHPGQVFEAKKLERNFYTTSSCGVCGKTSIEAIKTVHTLCTVPRDEAIFDAATICRMPDLLRQHQDAFDRTGGIHASAFFDRSGALVALSEDVGRHNALDKLIGASLMQGKLPCTAYALLLSGRASFELIQKAAAAGVPVVAAVGAPSSLAVEAALDFGITLIGFLRGDRMNIYTYQDRINLVSQ
jgi:FdhD protein